MHINPDHFLETPEGRITTPERNAWAWKECYLVLDEALRSAHPDTQLYVMVGAQGSGKSTWARRKLSEDTGAIIFDAILVKRVEREPILAAASLLGVPAVAVWFQAPLAVCLKRNAARPPDEVANEQGLRNVFAALEPPALAEGFAKVMLVT